MRWLLAALVILPVSACLKIGMPQDDDASSSSATGTAGTTSTDAGVTTGTGVNCGTDPASGITLCLGLSACPGVVVDSDQMPGCGYRVNGNVIDLECLCDDSLCPVGSAASCADAKALLQDQTSQGVCVGISEGRCTTVSQAVTNAGTNTASSCDKDCRANCVNDPACIQFCGC